MAKAKKKQTKKARAKETQDKKAKAREAHFGELDDHKMYSHSRCPGFAEP